MAAGDATAADVPGKYDVVINGKGYLYLDSVEESIPFRSHRANYGFTPTFIQRQNITGAYGDNQQDFFMNIRQNDFSQGEQQRFYQGGSSRYWAGQNIDVRIPGKVKLRSTVGVVAIGTPIRAMCGPAPGFSYESFFETAGHLWSLADNGVGTDRGAHGLAGTIRRFGMITDSANVYMTDAATVRKWNGAAFAAFSATGADQLTFLNNTLYGMRIGNGDFGRYDNAGVYTSIFSWKNGDGTVRNGVFGNMIPYGGKLALMWSNTDHSPELWMYDGNATSLVQTLPANFFAYDMCVQFGIIFISGGFLMSDASLNMQVRPAVFYWANGSLGLLWQANDYYNSGAAFSAPGGLVATPLFTCVSPFDGGVVWNDDSVGAFMYYDAANGGIQSIGTYGAGSSDTPLMIGGAHSFIHSRGIQSQIEQYPGTTTATSGYFLSSLYDFNNSMSKVFRGVTVEFDPASDGNGGSVDLAYQMDGIGGSYTSLATGVTSGTEVQFPANTKGHGVSIKVTLNKGTSTVGPVVKAVTVRGAPVLPSYAAGEYTIDCTSSADFPRELRDGSSHALSGYDQMKNLVTAAKATTPISITDKANGTFTGFVDTNDPDGFQVYEMHPDVDDLKHAGSFVVRVKVRGV